MSERGRQALRNTLVALVGVLAVATALAVIVWGDGGAADAEGPTTKRCPQGQVLVGGVAGGLEFQTNNLLPPGWRIHDSERPGTVQLTTTRRSATVEGDVPLSIVCQ